jgi:hypothetical protein
VVWIFTLVVSVYLVFLLLTTPVLLGTRSDENTRAWIVTLNRQSDGLLLPSKKVRSTSRLKVRRGAVKLKRNLFISNYNLESGILYGCRSILTGLNKMPIDIPVNPNKLDMRRKGNAL